MSNDCQDDSDENAELHPSHDVKSICIELRRCFEKKVPYTFINNICIAMNPFRVISGIYEDEVQQKYSRSALGFDSDQYGSGIDELPSHIFKISSRAFFGMRKGINEGNIAKKQTIVMNGESGAGKTESFKLLMKHIAHISEMDGAFRGGSLLTEKILSCNPILESFGNASTRRNANSSRFGKFTNLSFRGHSNEDTFHLCSAQCTVYLLEKSRVMQPIQDEWNFHILHQLCSAPEYLRDKLMLNDAKRPLRLVEIEKKITSRGEIDALRSEANCIYSFNDIHKQLLDLIPDHTVVHDVFRILSGILHLGQLSFIMPTKAATEHVEIDCLNLILSDCARLFGLNPDSSGTQHLQALLTYRSITLPSSREPLMIPFTDIAQASASRDAIGKEIYRRLFDWIVDKINAACQLSDKVSKFGLNKSWDTIGSIALLDIFGFEKFEKNHFDQLCINYANEKLQEMFSTDVVESVRKEYEAEGIDINMICDYPRYDQVVALIEHPKRGILSCLNDQCIVPRGNDGVFLKQLNHLQECAKSGDFISKYLVIDSLMISKRTCFGINHYAGTVLYFAEGFVEVNRDQYPSLLPETIVRYAQDNHLLQQLFIINDTRNTDVATKHKGSAFGSIGLKFKFQLNHLLQNIKSSTVQYVRCLKPNDRHDGSLFDESLVSSQLLNGGLIAAIELGHSVFPFKLSLLSFMQEFAFVYCQNIVLWNSPTIPIMEESCLDRCTHFLNAMKLIIVELKDPASHAIGKYHIFFGKIAFLSMQKYRRRCIDATIRLQCFRRRIVNERRLRMIRKRKRLLLYAAAIIQKNWKLYQARKLYLKSNGQERYCVSDEIIDASSATTEKDNTRISVYSLNDSNPYHKSVDAKAGSILSFFVTHEKAANSKNENISSTMKLKTFSIFVRNATFASRHTDYYEELRSECFKSIIVLSLLALTLYITFA